MAMSGGVDSAVAAARLQDQGYDVVGVTLHLWDYPKDDSGKAHGRCCAPEDQYDARRVADYLGFPHFTFDRRELFEAEVVTPFVEAYARGITPSPCTTCNRTVKLHELLGIAQKLDASFIATGHYARTGRDEAGVPFLAKGTDSNKDQSYFLYATPQALIERLVFPLGELTKPEVRADAVARKLPGATKGESQELCFVGAGAHAYASFVEARTDRVRPGPILNDRGEQVGTHEGIHKYTVGQRKGLGVAIGKPAFVTSVDAETGTVHLGNEDALYTRSAKLSDVVLAPGIKLPCAASVRVRYRHEGAMATVRASDSSGQGLASADVLFLAAVRAVAKGQVAVLYDGDRVLGGGVIVETAQ